MSGIEVVISNAVLICTHADNSNTRSHFTATLTTNVEMNQQDFGLITDNRVGANIGSNQSPFIMCSRSNQNNPEVVSATSAALGTPTPAPCNPLIISPWDHGCSVFTINGIQIITMNSTLRCSKGGIIKIIDSGQRPRMTILVPPS